VGGVPETELLSIYLKMSSSRTLQVALVGTRYTLPDDVVEMGELMMEWDRTCDASDGDPFIAYHVTSPKITNRRYCPYASPWDYRTKSSQVVR
jgi:hypothetical protein